MSRSQTVLDERDFAFIDFLVEQAVRNATQG